MGTSKALLLFDGEPLIVHVVATLQRLFAEWWWSPRRNRSAVDARPAGI